MSPSSKGRFSPFLKQCFVTGAVGFNIIGHGCMIGYPGVLLPQLSAADSAVPLTKEDGSWIASILSVSLLVGNFVTPPIMGRLGRKTAHYAVTVPALIGWFVTIPATSFQALLAGRLLHGLSYGMLVPLRSALIGEYTSPKNRGAFLATVSLAQVFGIFFVHLVGSLLSWQLTAVVSVIFSFVSLCMTFFSPESPSWLAEKGRYEECRQVFRWLRGDEEEAELEEMIRARSLENAIVRHKGKRMENILEIIKKKEFYIPIILMIHVYSSSAFCGGQILANYATDIIYKVMGPEVNAHFWMVAFDVLRLIANTIAIYVYKRFARRKIMISTAVLCIGSMFLVAGYTYARIRGVLSYDAEWIPALLLILQVTSLSIGAVALPNVIAGEVYPLSYRAIGGCISIIISLAFMFPVVKTYLYLLDTIGAHGTYALYAGLMTYSFIVTCFIMPETKGKTLQQIEEEFKGKPTQSATEDIEARIPLQTKEKVPEIMAAAKS